jgi:hypothetical protein
VLVDVGQRPPTREFRDLAVAVAGDEEGEVVALARRELRDDAQGFARFERIVDRGTVLMTSSQFTAVAMASRCASRRSIADRR